MTDENRTPGTLPLDVNPKQDPNDDAHDFGGAPENENYPTNEPTRMNVETLPAQDSDEVREDPNAAKFVAATEVVEPADEAAFVAETEPPRGALFGNDDTSIVANLPDTNADLAETIRKTQQDVTYLRNSVEELMRILPGATAALEKGPLGAMFGGMFSRS